MPNQRTPSTLPLLTLENVHVEVCGSPILKGISLTLYPGEVHAIMGPNGSGKSTLSYLLARHPDYRLTQGHIRYQNQDLAEFSPEQAARAGLFLSFQYPVEIPGVTNLQFLKASVNAIRKSQTKPLLDAVDFLKTVKTKIKLLDMPEGLLYRSINEGFSGGEKKRNEMLQFELLEPLLAILDETDSGLDIDALKIVSASINRLRSPKRTILLITHYQRLLEYVEPDFVHVLANGKIVKSGDKTLAKTLEEKGYQWL